MHGAILSALGSGPASGELHDGLRTSPQSSRAARRTRLPRLGYGRSNWTPGADRGCTPVGMPRREACSSRRRCRGALVRDAIACPAAVLRRPGAALPTGQRSHARRSNVVGCPSPGADWLS
jgi:hypothetical protein